MNDFERFEILPGSERVSFPLDQITEVDFDFPVTVTMHLRRKTPLQIDKGTHKERFLSREQLGIQHGASFRDIKVVFAFAKHFDLSILSADMSSRTVVLTGNSSEMSKAFNVKLATGIYRGKIFRVRSGHICIPSELLGVVTGVFGLDNRPQALSHLRKTEMVPRLFGMKPAAFDGNQLAQLYSFPEATGGGQTIALIELGGGFLDQDISAYFSALKLSCPEVTSISVGGASNAPGLNEDEDTEVALDIQVAGAAAPGAKIVVYFAQNTDQGFLQAILAAVHDSVNKPTVISISWGGAEVTWTAQQMSAMDEAFESAAAIGISVFVAAGDDGADDNVGDGKAHVDFPASSPSVTGCGGTSLKTGNGVLQESVWNDGDGSASGGGISNFFARPVYQQGINMPNNLNGTLQGRGVPDVAAVADPDTGYAVLVDGLWEVVGGTSAVAPLMAGLQARINQLSGRANGLMNSVFYNAFHNEAFVDIVGGNNSCDGVVGYSAVVGWDPVTGCGRPKGLSVFQSMQS